MQSQMIPVNYHERAGQLLRCVARVVIPTSNGLETSGTGFLIAGNWFLTNHHVLPSAEIAARAIFEFNYERDQDGFLLPVESFKVDPAPGCYIFSDQLNGDDWAAVKLLGNPVAKFGAVPLSRDIVVHKGDALSIFQHPAGQPKLFHRCVDAVRPSPEPLRRLHYQSETAPGSSGSPVFNDRWELVAIHHRSVEVRNLETAKLEHQKVGTPAAAIIPKLEALGAWQAGIVLVLPKPLQETGAMAPGSAWYVARHCDQQALQAIESGAGTIFIVGARHSGKSSLAKRHVYMLEKSGWPSVWFDAEADFSANHYASVDQLFERMIKKIAQRFPHEMSDEIEGARGTPSFLKDYLAEAFPNNSNKRLVIVIDRADSFLGKPCADDFFLGLRTVNDASMHGNIRLILTYSRNMKQSTQDGSIFSAAADVIDVCDFSLNDLSALHSRFGANLLEPSELEDLHFFLGGHPLLCRLFLNELHFKKASRLSYSRLREDILDSGGILAAHLDCVMGELDDASAATREAFKRLVRSEPGALNRHNLPDLIALGLVSGSTPARAKVRSDLYSRYIYANL